MNSCVVLLLPFFYSRSMQKVLLKVLPKIGLTIICVILLGVGLFIGINVWDHYRRNPEAYCKTFDQEKKRLAAIGGTKHHSDLFNVNIDNADELARSYKVLANIAPKDILPHIEILTEEYQRGEISGFRFSALMGSEVKIRTWNAEHCTRTP